MEIRFQKVTKFLSKKLSKITPFFDVPFGVFFREITGNGHSRLLKFKIFWWSMRLDPPRMCEF
jgi:hypothetical protein